MKTPTLHRDDEPTLSLVGLGCNNFGMKIDEEASHRVVHAALDAGITHFDTAESYGSGSSETFLGTALQGRRDDAFIATKFTRRPADEPYTPGALRRRIEEACEGSLRRLGTDRIDLYYQHYVDPDAPVDELVGTFEALVDAGKVRYVALSNAPADQLLAMSPGVAALQIEWSLLARGAEADVVPAAADLGVGVVPYFPLASGLLTGKYRRGEALPEGSRLASMPYFSSVVTDENLERVERLRSFATGRGHSLLELAVAWLVAQRPVLSVICGATSPQQVAANAAATSWRLSADDLADVDRCLDLAR